MLPVLLVLPFSALQRAEIAEMVMPAPEAERLRTFSALQRAEIAEICGRGVARRGADRLSVLFNEPKLLKFWEGQPQIAETITFSALQRAEIAEIPPAPARPRFGERFQCSSTSRNC